MADVIDDLMRANLLAVFNERDESRRRAAIEATYAPDVRWTDADHDPFAKRWNVWGRRGSLAQEPSKKE